MQANNSLIMLTERLGALGDQMGAEQRLLGGLAENQAGLRTAIERLANVGRGSGMDEATQTHIRNIDIYMARLLEEISSGRDDLIQQLRSEIKLLARTIAARVKE